MKDEFSNENMLKILIDQKKYLEAFRIYKELVKNGSIADPSAYQSLITEVSRIDPVLTMDRETKEKKISRLSAILSRIRRLKKEPRKIRKEDTCEDIKEEIIITATGAVEAVCREIRDGVKIEMPAQEEPTDMLQAIETFTARSVGSVMNVICGNFSKDILSKRPVSDRIEMLKEMLRRVEIIKGQRKKELLNV